MITIMAMLGVVLYGAARGQDEGGGKERKENQKKLDQYKEISRYMRRIKGGPSRAGGTFSAVDGAQCVGHQVNIQYPFLLFFFITCITTMIPCIHLWC